MLEREEVPRVHQRAEAVKLFALKNSPQQGLAGRAVAGWIHPGSPVHLPGRGEAGDF